MSCSDCFYKIRRNDIDYCSVYNSVIESMKENCEYYEKLK
jgi:hypothetical protein